VFSAIRSDLNQHFSCGSSCTEIKTVFGQATMRSETNWGQKAPMMKVVRGIIPQREDLFFFRLDEATQSYCRFSESPDGKNPIKIKSTTRRTSLGHNVHELVIDFLYLVFANELVERMEGYHCIR
jgi:hypothetical protein